LGSPLALWLDGADASTIILNGSNVSQWNDKSGNSRNASQSTATLQPLYQATGFNGRPALSFDGGDVLVNAAPGGILQNAPGGSIAVVANYTDAAVQRYSAFIATGSGTTRLGALYTSAGQLANAARTADADAEALSSVALSPATGVVNTAIANYSAGTLANFSNGATGGTAALASSGNTSNTASTSIMIGATSLGATTNPMLGTIAEIVVTSTALSVADRQILEGYLAWKWDSINENTALVTALPSNHPYKSAPPTNI
jgi:hypothetical protein